MRRAPSHVHRMREDLRVLSEIPNRVLPIHAVADSVLVRFGESVDR